MARKNPFKKQSIIDTLTNVGIGGAANVAIDYVIDTVNNATVTEYKDYGKIALGVLAGSMVSNKMLRAAADGVAVVGVSNLISSLIKTSGESNPNPNPSGPTGLAYGTIGRVRMGNRRFSNRSTRGFSVGSAFGMDK